MELRSDTSASTRRCEVSATEPKAAPLRWVTNRGLWASLLFALPALAPLAQPGIGDMADAALHIYRTVELTQLWHNGIIYSRWAPDMAFGLGYPLFNFYTPLLYYVAGAVHLAGLNVELAMKVTLALATLLGCAGLYALAREWVGEAGAVLAAIAYTWAPFRLREMYFQGDFAQYLGLSLPPMIMWALHRLAVTGKDRYLALSAAGYAALFLSHSISTMLFTPLILAYVLFLILVRPEARRNTGQIAIAFVVAIGLSAFFWFPALYESQFVRLDALRTDDFDFRRHFPQAWELIAPSVPLDIGAANPFVPFNLGLAQVVLALPSLLALGHRQLRWPAIAGWLGMLACAFMCLSISTPVWQLIPPLAFTEFPWRWLGVAAVPLALLVGVSAKVMPRRLTVCMVVVAGLAIALSAFPHLYPRPPFAHYDQATVVDMMRDELSTQAIGTTSAGEYLPKGIVEKPRTSPMVEVYLNGQPIDRLNYDTLPAGAVATLDEHRAISDRWHLSLPVTATLQVNTLCYPGWTAYLDGQRVPIVPSDPQHLISVQVPMGEHELELRFEDTAERQLANAASAVTLVALVGILLWRRRQRVFTAGQRGTPAAMGESAPDRGGLIGYEMLAISGVALAILLAKVAYIDPYTSWFRAASDPHQPPGMEYPLHIDFQDKVQLVGYSFDRAAALPGDRITVTLYWRALQPIEYEYSAFIHLVDGSDKLAQQDNVHPGGIPTRSWRPDQFVRDEHPLTIPPGTAPGVYNLLAGLYDQKGLAPTLSPSEGGHVTIPLLVSASVPPSATTVSYRLGEMVDLIAYELVDSEIGQDEEVTVRLYWQATGKMDRDYTVFVHLYDAQGKLHGTGDGQPLNGKYPTSIWRQGEVIEDTHTVHLDPGSPPGDYTLAVGLYDLNTLTRLEARYGVRSRCPDDAIALQPTIRVRSE